MRSFLLAGGFAALMLSSAFAQGNGSVKPYQVFDHQKHVPTMEDTKLDCAGCHVFDLDKKNKVVVLQTDKKNFFSEPMKDVCHDCHRKLRSRTSHTVDLFTCTLCHMDSAGIVPDNHKVGWEKKHAYIKYNETECMQCHQTSYCIDCHRRFEPNRPKAHSRNFRFFHAIEARMKPASCYSCHRKSQCTDCHRNGGPLR